MRDTESISLGHLEVQLMEILWAQGAGRVQDALQELDRQGRPLAYTTVMTTLDRLYKKGLLGRCKDDRAFVYTPRYTRLEWERRRAGAFLSGFFDSPDQTGGELLISCFVEAVGRQDAALLDELERRIQAKRRELEEERNA